MILLIHSKGKKLLRAVREEVVLDLDHTNLAQAFWEMARKFPSELICWVEESYFENADFSNLKNIFHHDLIMASYAVGHQFLPPSLGYVDQSPFINVNRNVSFGTWKMSSDIGGIKAEVLLKFKPLFSEVKNFEYLLNSIGKLGQENGLFCYSEPQLIKTKPSKEFVYTASLDQVFSFVYQYYNTAWVFVLFWCFLKYEKKLPVFPFFKSFFNKKYFQKEIGLKDFKIQSSKKQDTVNSIDVIIPTMGRAQHLLQVLEDLRNQTLQPVKVIVVEQNADVESTTDLSEIKNRKWPFQIIHHFIHQTGACNARNVALTEVTANWVFLCDDDNRIAPDFIQKSFRLIKDFGIQVLNAAYLQPEEKKVFNIAKQWGTFGSGNSIVKRSAIENVRFSSVFEHGYGEDKDFGMQLRNKGVDIIYHPEIEILHLKAPMGGFRQQIVKDWEQEDPAPKPSPTIMAFAMLYHTEEQIKGYKTSLFIKFYSRQPDKNPFSYVKQMKTRWKQSEKWAKKLLNEFEAKNVKE